MTGSTLSPAHTTGSTKQRRHHKKSRNGCGTCKRRKVKSQCDEVRPSCNHCSKFGILCDFTSTQNNVEVAECIPRTSKRGRGRPRNTKNYASPPSTTESRPSEATDNASLGDAARVGAVDASSLLNAADLELMHHYATCTAATLGDPKLWRDRVPTLAFRHHCILGMMLNIAALHLARQRSRDSALYLRLAKHHKAPALRQATDLLPQLDAQNCQVLYFVTVLVCFSALAEGPTAGHFLVFAEHDEVPWLTLLRGVRYVVSTAGWPAILAGGVLSVSSEEGQDEEVHPAFQVLAPPEVLQWQGSLDGISRLQKQQDFASEVYDSALESLTTCFEQLYGTPSNPKSESRDGFQVVISWIYRLEDEFVDKVKEKDSVALVMLAHFAVLLGTLHSTWFLDGWAKHLVCSIREVLDPAQRYYVLWPEAMLKVLGIA